MQEEEVVSLKIFDKEKGDVLLFEGKVSTDVEPHELMKLRCFRERFLRGIFSKATNEEVKCLKGLGNNVELVAERGGYRKFSGVLYVVAEDGVLRKSKSVPSCECVMMSVWWLSQEKCEEAFKCGTLEELEFHFCEVSLVPTKIGKLKKLTALRLVRLDNVRSIPEEIGEMVNLKELRIEHCWIKSLPKRLKELRLKALSLCSLYHLRLHGEDLALFSQLKHLTITHCRDVFTPQFTKAFWEMIKSTTDIHLLELDWDERNLEMVAAALKENGSIIDGGEDSESYVHIFFRNKDNHERAMACVLRILAMRRWRNALNSVPKEMIQMLAMMLWNTKCDVEAWTRRPKE